MAGRKTRIEKLQAEIKNLKRENDELRVSKEALRIEVAEMHKREEIRVMKKKEVFWYIYDTLVSALILVFIYWIAINGYGNLDIPYIFFSVLVVLISVKCIVDNKQFNVKPIIHILLNDLIKPAISMLVGLFLCMIYLGEGWKEAKNYALDTGYTGVLVMITIIMVVIIIAVSYCMVNSWIKILNRLQKGRT